MWSFADAFVVNGHGNGSWVNVIYILSPPYKINLQGLPTCVHIQFFNKLFVFYDDSVRRKCRRKKRPKEMV